MDSHHTKATKMAMDDMQKVIDSFADDQPFMVEEVSERTKERRELIAKAAPDIQALQGTFPQSLVERLARLDRD